ncbi:MAG TPA: hypothetical protein VFG04_06850 [Planctomycetaceae bacterium]|nr:hypothetical protein [Planctomycetaceae bacterium]
MAGRRDEILSGQNRLLTPTELAVDEEGRLTFYMENQGVYVWSTLAEGEDPPVSGMFEEIPPTWTEEDMSLSEFLVEVCLFEAILSAQFGAAAGCASQTTLDRLRPELPLLPLAPWRWPNYPSQFFAREGAFAFVAPYEHRGEVAFSIWIGAKTSRPLSFLEGMVGDPEWEHVAL